MSASDIDDKMKRYIRNNLSPTQEEQDYVSDKYEEISNFLAGDCFRSGSFARYTAVHPIHDLDVIWIVNDDKIWENTESYMQQVAIELAEQYEEFGSTVPKVTVQTHSVTLLFDDLEGKEFSIDVVPAEPTQYRNENDDPIFKVPEIIKKSHGQREEYYKSHPQVGWTYTDPKGYITNATGLDSVSNGNYRKTTKFLKAWRNGVKRKYPDEMKLQAFHLEQICASEFAKNPSMSVYEAARYCFLILPDYIRNAPLIKDRAYTMLSGDDKYIDDYLDLRNGKVTQTQKELIMTEVMIANEIMPEFVWNDDTDSVIEKILNIKASSARTATPTTYAAPPAQWHE